MAPETASLKSERVSAASPGQRYVRFIGLAVLIVVALVGVGFVPTRRLAGEEALPAMVAGCVIGLAGAALAGGLIVAARIDSPTARMQTAFLAMMVRLAAAVVLGLAAALSGELARTPLLFWLAASYVALLPLEVKLAIDS